MNLYCKELGCVKIPQVHLHYKQTNKSIILAMQVDSVQSGADFETNPIIRIIDFYKNLQQTVLEQNWL